MKILVTGGAGFIGNHLTLRLLADGHDVVIVEDVVTTGGSSLQAIERALAYGLKVRGVIAIVDRMEGGVEAFSAKGYWCKSLFNIRDFGIDPPTK